MRRQTQGWCYMFSMPANTSKRFWSQALTQMFSSFFYHFNLSSMQIYIFSQGWETLDELSTLGPLQKTSTKISVYMNLQKKSLLSALVGFHSFTGCNTVSAFAGRGKIKPLMLMMKCKDYVEMFASFGSGTEMDDLLITWLKRFVCHMCGWKGKDSVNNIRYWMYCQSRAKIACEKLPPWEDVLQLHILRENY